MNLQAQIDLSSMLADFLHVIVRNALEIFGNYCNINIAIRICQSLGHRSKKISFGDIDAIFN